VGCTRGALHCTSMYAEALASSTSPYRHATHTHTHKHTRTHTHTHKDKNTHNRRQTHSPCTRTHARTHARTHTHWRLKRRAGRASAALRNRRIHVPSLATLHELFVPAPRPPSPPLASLASLLPPPSLQRLPHPPPKSTWDKLWVCGPQTSVEQLCEYLQILQATDKAVWVTGMWMRWVKVVWVKQMWV
jgi:hypothetical protein